MIMTLFLKAILAGFIITIPVGPIGLVVVQRTIARGRWHGFFSGIGAALSDLVYAGVAIWGLHLIVGFIEEQASIIQFIGSVLLLGLGIYMFRSNPVRRVSSTKIEANSLLREIGTTFLFSISNPLIIFYYLSSFAFFRLTGNGTTNELFLGWIGFICGVLIWYFLLTEIIHVLRKKFNIRRIGIINKLSGGLIIIISAIGIVYVIINLFNPA